MQLTLLYCSIIYMSITEPAWLLLVVSLPTSSATARMRIWRALKAQGCVALRDGAYLLPFAAEREAALQELAAGCRHEGGSAWLMAAQPRSAEETDAWRGLFDRSEDHAELRKAWKGARHGLAALAAPELARLLRRLRREFESAQAIDFFPGESGLELQASWTDLKQRIEDLISPGEPHGAAGAIPRLDAAGYQGRIWATRRHLWIDRVASAWLIHRFIDREARFEWLAQPSDCPQRALGFDFDGATFTHVGEHVTFETLMLSFGLQSDPALCRLAAMVHTLDVGGESVAEAQGFEAVVAGARERLVDDDALLSEISLVLDSLYVHFQREGRRSGAVTSAG